MKHKILSFFAALALCLNLFPVAAFAAEGLPELETGAVIGESQPTRVAVKSPRAASPLTITVDGTSQTLTLNSDGSFDWPSIAANQDEPKAIVISGTGTIIGPVKVDTVAGGSFSYERGPATVTFAQGANVTVVKNSAVPYNTINLSVRGDKLVVSPGAVVTVQGEVAVGADALVGGSVAVDGGSLQADDLGVESLEVKNGGTIHSNRTFFLNSSHSSTSLGIVDGGALEIQTNDGRPAVALTKDGGNIEDGDKAFFENKVSQFVNLSENGCHFGFYADPKGGSLYTLLKDADDTPVTELTFKAVQVIPVTGVTITPSLTLSPGDTRQLTATVKPDNTTLSKAVRWSSGDTAIATVDERTGTVSAVGVGSTVITATTYSNSFYSGSGSSLDQRYTATCTVTVRDAADIAGSDSTDDSDDDSYDDENRFWEEVKARIEAAAPGNTVSINAKGYDRMPQSSMEALKKRGVGLTITWNGGQDIVIPAGKALSEEWRDYYPFSYLADYDFTRVASRMNPSTGGVWNGDLAAAAIPQADADVAVPAQNEAAKPSSSCDGGAFVAIAVALLAAAICGSRLFRKRRNPR